MITGKNEKIFTKHISREYKCKFHVKKCTSNQKWNNNKCRCECENPKKTCVEKKLKFGILLHVVSKMV